MIKILLIWKVSPWFWFQRNLKSNWRKLKAKLGRIEEIKKRSLSLPSVSPGKAAGFSKKREVRSCFLHLSIFTVVERRRPRLPCFLKEPSQPPSTVSSSKYTKVKIQDCVHSWHGKWMDEHLSWMDHIYYGWIKSIMNG